MEFSIRLVTKAAELMAQEVREKIGDGAQLGEIEQTLRELGQAVSGLGLQKVIEAQEEKNTSWVKCECGMEAQPLGKRQAVLMKYYCDIQEAEQFGRLLWASSIQSQ